MSRGDIAQTSGNVAAIMDPTEIELALCSRRHGALARFASFEDFSSAASFCPYLPESLACMTRSNGAWVRWEGSKDAKLLARIERHLAISSRRDRSPGARAAIAGSRLEIDLDHEIEVGPFDQVEPRLPRMSAVAATVQIERSAHHCLRLVLHPITSRNAPIPMQFFIAATDGQTGARFEATVDRKRSGARIVARRRLSIPMKDFAIAELKPIARTGRLGILRAEYFRFDKKANRRYAFRALVRGKVDGLPRKSPAVTRWSLRSQPQVAGQELAEARDKRRQSSWSTRRPDVAP